MDKYIYDERNGFWYELQGEHYLPCLTLPPEEETPIEIWESECLWHSGCEPAEQTGEKSAQAISARVQEAAYTKLLLNGRLNAYLVDLDKQAQGMFLRLVKKL